MNGKDKRLTYLELPVVFPDKAGKLFQVLTTQRRLLLKVTARRQLDDDTKALLISVAEGYDVAVDLLSWMKATLQEVASDAKTLIEGAKMRDVLEEQARLISAYMDFEIEQLKQKRLLNGQEFNDAKRTGSKSTSY